MDIDLETLAQFGFEFTNVDDDLQEVDLMDIIQPQEPCSVVLDEFIDEYLSGSDSQSSLGSSSSQCSAAVVSPVSSSSDVLEEKEPNSYQELFNMIDGYSETVSNQKVVDVALQNDQVYEVIQVVSTEESSENLVPVACFTVDEHGFLQPYDQKNSSVTAPQRKRKGRKPLPKPKVNPGDPYCGRCDKLFKSKRGLIQHVNSHHTGIKPNSCDICGKRFDRVEDMLKHRERHSTENKPLECPVESCPKRFMYPTDLKRHVAMTHGEAPHNCSICGKGFGRRDHMEKHEMGHVYNTVKKC